jgi:hypothetical protein
LAIGLSHRRQVHPQIAIRSANDRIEKNLQLNLYTSEFYGLPRDLFTGREINWHRQQLGILGLIDRAPRATRFGFCGARGSDMHNPSLDRRLQPVVGSRNSRQSPMTSREE